jgi:hypothetical protein
MEHQLNINANNYNMEISTKTKSLEICSKYTSNGKKYVIQNLQNYC